VEVKEGFPKELENIVEKVPMSEEQYARYISARMLEQDETKKGYRVKESRFSSSTGGSSTYRVKTRQISNYCIPEYALGPVYGNKSREKFINKITNEDLYNLKKYSPKMEKILNNINLHNGKKGIVYSQFVSGEGIAIFAKVLKVYDYLQYDFKDLGDDDINTNAKTFAVLSGDITPEKRTEIINIFNENNNKIDLLLLSGALAEGIDLKRVRHVHIMEPFWNYARINQVKTRAIRYLSHQDLPEVDRNVQVYIYLSDYPTNTPKDKMKELTTDLDLYNKSINNMQIINTFITAIAESSIDCSMHYDKLNNSIKEKIKCKLCSPDNSILFHPLITKDMNLPNTCKPFSDEKIIVNTIELNGEKYYYKVISPSEFKLYHFNKKLNNYTNMLLSDVMYPLVMEAVVMKELN
jgi:hypothetical protein